MAAVPVRDEPIGSRRVGCSTAGRKRRNSSWGRRRFQRLLRASWPAPPAPTTTRCAEFAGRRNCVLSAGRKFSQFAGCVLARTGELARKFWGHIRGGKSCETSCAFDSGELKGLICARFGGAAPMNALKAASGCARPGELLRCVASHERISSNAPTVESLPSRRAGGGGCVIVVAGGAAAAAAAVVGAARRGARKAARATAPRFCAQTAAAAAKFNEQPSSFTSPSVFTF